MCDPGLDGDQKGIKQFVGVAFADHQNGVAVLLLQLLGVGIQLETGVGGGIQNKLPSQFADMGLVVQHPGNRTHTVSGLGRQILDGHGTASFICKYLETFQFSYKRIIPDIYHFCKPVAGNSPDRIPKKYPDC